MKESSLRDFIYLDLPKLASLYSQLTGGLITETELSTGDERDQRNIRKYDVKIFKPEFGGTEKQIQRFTETRVMHHDLFNTVEQLLFKHSYAIDVNEKISAFDIENGRAHSIFRKAFYVRATGWALLEDYEKIKYIAQQHNKISSFIRESTKSNLKKSDGYREIEGQIEQLKNKAKNEKDRNTKARLKANIESLENKIENDINSIIALKNLDQWIIDGVRAWVDTFMPNAIYFHLYPFDDLESFHIKANLKNHCFVDGDIKSIDYAYTGRPNVKLCTLGLVTSIPSKDGHPFDPMSEFKDHDPNDINDDPFGFEGAFRGVFRAFEGMAKFGNFERYPNITIYPLAVFRDIQANQEL